MNLDNILYVEGVKEYVKIVMEGDEKPIMSLMNMKSLEDFLPSPEFLRIHRLFIVHMPKVNTIDRMRLVIGKNVISVSDTYKSTRTPCRNTSTRIPWHNWFLILQLYGFAVLQNLSIALTNLRKTVKPHNRKTA